MVKVRHNTELLEKALDAVNQRLLVPSKVAEAEAQQRLARAAALRRLATGGAIAIVAVAIGIAAYLLKLESEPAGLERIAAVDRDESQPSTPQFPQLPPIEQAGTGSQGQSNGTGTLERPSFGSSGGTITRNYDIFQRRTIFALGRSWTLVAGHHYETSEDTTFRRAWCYTQDEIDGLDLQLELVQRDTPAARPKAPMSGPKTIDAFSLSVPEALALATDCPWVDVKKYSVYDFASGPHTKTNPFSDDPPELSLDGDVLVYRGSINERTLSRLQAFRFRVLRIESAGGDIKRAIKIGRWLRANGINVVMNESCLSACVYLVAGGVKRAAGDGARIGIHQFRSTTFSSPELHEQTSQVVSAKITRYLRDMGVSVELWEEASKVLPNKFDYIELETARKWNLVNADDDETLLHTGNVIGHLLADTDLPNGDIFGKGLTNVASAERCRAICVSERSCRAITYNETYRKCFIKNEVFPTKSHSGATSWIRPQGMNDRKMSVPSGAVSRNWLVQTGSFSSQDRAERKRTEIEAAFAGTSLGDSSRIRTVPGPLSGIFGNMFKVQFGPFVEEVARAFCGQLEAGDIDCFVVAVSS